eukprot:715093-Rhodomonas_salina.2
MHKEALIRKAHRPRHPQCLAPGRHRLFSGAVLPRLDAHHHTLAQSQTSVGFRERKKRILSQQT